MEPGSIEERQDLSPARVSGVVVDLAGRRLTLEASAVVRLRDVAAAKAGSSSSARDLALLLDRALVSQHALALRPGERRVLAGIAVEAGLAELAPKLATA